MMFIKAYMTRKFVSFLQTFQILSMIDPFVVNTGTGPVDFKFFKAVYIDGMPAFVDQYTQANIIQASYIISSCSSYR
jgi:hypothetical protein